MHSMQATRRFVQAASIAALLAATCVPSAHAARLRVVSAGGGTRHASTAVVRQGPAGGTVARSRSTERNADGSAATSSSLSAANARGSITRTTSATRDGAGDASASRVTTLTNASNGHTAQVSTNVNRSPSGATSERSISCMDASGAAIACR